MCMAYQKNSDTVFVGAYVCAFEKGVEFVTMQAPGTGFLPLHMTLGQS